MGWTSTTLGTILPAAIFLSWPVALSAESGTTADRNAFSQPDATLDAAGLDRFRAGNLVFRKLWVVAPANFTASDGLGPRFNARSCQTCHLRDGRGQLPDTAAGNVSGLVLRLSLAGHPDPTYGSQLQTLAAPALVPEGQIAITYRDIAVPVRDAPPVVLTHPQYQVVSLSSGPLDPATVLSPRLAPPLIGLGLLAGISEAAILAQADPDDRDSDGISGRANYVPDATGGVALGRFGLKAGTADLRQQAAVAFSLDLGLSTALRPAPWGDCTGAQTACLLAPHGVDSSSPDATEVEDGDLDLVAFYSASLAVPSPRDVDSPQVRRGEAVFAAVGCAACHAPAFAFPASVRPFTDLLLHDMGPALADGMAEGLATGREWRTPPLWGIGLTRTVSGQTHFLHDGRAGSLLEAVLWHGGEAEAARNRVIALPPADREALITFLESL